MITTRDRLHALRDTPAPPLLILTAHVQLQEAVTDVTTFLLGNLAGKRGRFRRTMLGKRVDFSARAVITPGPDLPLDEVGLPEPVARELFTPHLRRALRAEGVPGRVVHQILHDARPLDADTRDTLSRVMAVHVVLLNRAPTLHRQSLLAFRPVLVPGLTLRLHPMACEGLNADFDGDTMAVHLPLSAAAQDEARRLLTLRANLRSPATGQLAVAPSKDMLLGLYRLTQRREGVPGAPLALFRDADEAALAVELGHLDWVEACRVRLGGQVHETTPGRAKVWQAVAEVTEDPDLYALELLDKAATRALLTRTLTTHGAAVTVTLLDALKTLGFRHATSDGVTVGIEDVLPAPEREEVILAAQVQAQQLTRARDTGHATPDETDRALIAHWTAVKDDLGARTVAHLRAHPENPLGVMLASGARGNASQVTQLAGMRGLMARADGSTFPTPILASFRLGLTATEFFISSHGARKGSADTALRTAQAGYLTRRLVNLLQAVQVTEEDCGTPWGVTEDAEVPGRTVLTVLPDGRRIVRSPLTCQSSAGVCRACMGLALHDLTPHPLGANVGILAAQSLGEPGTQLTLRTFHTGGVAGNDMTAGLGTLVKLLERPGPHPPRVAQDLLAVYASQGVTLHPVHAELTARTLAGRGLTPGRSGGGWLAQAAAGRTTPILTRAALHAERDPLTDPLARVMTPGLHQLAATDRRVAGPPAWSHSAPGAARLPVPSAQSPRPLSPAPEPR
ncbi:hypothetical protein [Deinococcus enclensis]|uniref:DNA-directed RNA polymerase n=1 Tax=Deinococcus enclensis TaxID=1049582 RepID=A0ABT9MFZ2_9DEIO|nr:hypothetical protein [Deinococcus enclensis]MDP9765471.1 DNA-directed RNA polymerase beta' subunit [Deinococcus enclensis]